MRRLLINIIIVFGFILIFNVNAYSKIGKGNLNINDQTLDYLIEYLRNEFSTSFIISKDGNDGYYGICPSGNCAGGSGATSTLLKRCQKETGDKCYIFAQTKKKQKIIRWNEIDYIFPEGDFSYTSSVKNPLPEKEGIKKSITDNDIKELLSKYNFLNTNSKTAETTQSSTKKENIKVASANKGDLDGFMNALEKAKNAGLTIDADTTAKQFGYKNFNEFFIHFKSENELGDLTIEEAKEFLLGSDNTIDIVESQENLDKLYDLIMNNEYFVKWQKKKNSYLNSFKKGKYKKNDLDQMALAVYIDYEKEMSKISKEPNIEKITRFAWDWGWSLGSGYTPFKWALEGCRKEAKKYKLSGGECIIVDLRTKNPDKIVNYLKPKLKNATKKKTLVTQKKIKIKKKSLDNDPPVIDIKDTFIVKSSNFEIDGKVSDSGSENIYINVSGQDIPVDNGKFKIKKYSPIDTEIRIIATDEWGNESTKIVKIKIKEDQKIVETLDPLNPSKLRAKIDRNKVALIIGIENYSDIVKASFAKADAQYFREYAYKGLGIENKNIKLLLDEEATFIEINKVLKKWLVSKIKPNQTELVIYYAGHGLASKNGEELYLLPQDGDPDLLSISSISRNNLFSEIQSLNPKSVTIFLDACYSGSSRDNEILLADARPVRIVAEQNEDVPENFTIFSASQLDQISSGLKEAKHGIFSYFLMKGLEGKADFNKDKRITNGELLAYMDKNVSEKASELGRKQNPALLGDPNKVLMSYSEILK
jgi:hypothetical protein